MLASALALALVCALAGGASAKTVWLCKPGMKNDPCTPSLKTTVFSPAGKKLRVVTPARPKAPKIDCFYVYPTVSDQPGLNANLNVDPVEQVVALYQAARYSQYCRVFAPMYRQGTVGGIGGSQIGMAFANAYVDVLAAWKDYLAHYNHGRGVVLIGHSQGRSSSAADQRADRQQAGDPAPPDLGDPARRQRDRPQGQGRRRRLQATCRPAARARQLGCVIAFSTFDQPPPPNSLFGRTSTPGLQVLCTNPAALRGGSGLIDPMLPTAPFAPGSIALGIQLLEFKLPSASTPWIEAPGSYAAHCSSAGGANVLQISARGFAVNPKPSPDATWGEHLADGNIALGNLLKLVGSESAAYLARG